tara:strand:+ start:5095 stop:7830 length:2736 start_codon:yes stop_codon:yes gene_type:complete
MRRITSIILVMVFFMGCKSSFKTNFTDFNAYYNTFFNAKKSFNLGEDKSESQARNYNTLQPIRIYETPLGAGAADFQNAIDKGADILRKYDDSKWVDDALLIIGKSFFYRKEYFSADQKFDELYLSSENIEMKQEAAFWKGRVLLELELYNQGVQYLTDQLSIFEGDWENRIQHQVQTVLAEHYVERESWVNALDLLNESVQKLPKKTYKERGFFLIGQLNEILGNSEAAFEAYNEVTKNYTNYDLQFEAQKKQAEVARSLGKSDEAYRVFAKMVRDDKNSEFISELNFELGKTEQDRGNYKKAEEIYIKILRDSRVKPKPVTKAKVYNGLAEINRFNYNDYVLAAAYYDSAAKVNAPIDELPDDFNATEFAISFGDYSKIKYEIHFQDSLLWLGSLPQEQFDSVLVELERLKREEIARLQKEQEDRRNTLINVNATNNQVNGAESIEKNGFLSYKNPVLLAESAQQFRALWNGRPLLDNWRVSSLIVDIVQEQNETNLNRGNSTKKGTDNEVFVSIDLSRIPFTPQDQDSVREDIAYLNYELANLFFLSLNLPDSAEYYFNKVLDERPNSKVAPVSLYSLSELYSIQNNNGKAFDEAEELVNRFPNTVYADRLVEKFNIERPYIQEISESNPRVEYLNIKNNQEISLENKVEALLDFESLYSGTKLGAQALYDGIETYILLGKQDSMFIKKIELWNHVNKTWEKQKEQLETQKDSAQVSLEDSSITIADSLYFTLLIDSTLSQPDFKIEFPYRGEYWDSTRSTIDYFLAGYSNSTLNKRVRRLKNEFELPIEEAETEEEISNSISGINEPSNYLSCTEIEQSVLIRGGTENFLALVNMPQSVQESEISFLFFLNIRGIIDEFKLVSDTRNQNLIDAFIYAIDENLSFEPVLVNGVASPVSCEVTFQIPTD